MKSVLRLFAVGIGVAASSIAIAGQPRVKYDPGAAINAGQPVGVAIAQLAALAESSGQEGTQLLWKAWGRQIKVAWSNDAVADSVDLRRFIAGMLPKLDNPAGEWRPGLQSDWYWVCLPQLNDADYAETLVTWVRHRGFWKANKRGRIAALVPQQVSTIQALIGPASGWRTAKYPGLAVLAFEGNASVNLWIASARASISADELSATSDDRRLVYPYVREELRVIEKIASVANSPTKLLEGALVLEGDLSLDSAPGRWAVNRSIALGTPRSTVSSEVIKWLDSAWAKAVGSQQAAVIRQKLVCIEEGWILATDLPLIPMQSRDPDCRPEE